MVKVVRGSLHVLGDGDQRVLADFVVAQAVGINNEGAARLGSGHATYEGRTSHVATRELGSVRKWEVCIRLLQLHGRRKGRAANDAFNKGDGTIITQVVSCKV